MNRHAATQAVEHTRLFTDTHTSKHVYRQTHTQRQIHNTCNHTSSELSFSRATQCHVTLFLQSLKQQPIVIKFASFLHQINCDLGLVFADKLGVLLRPWWLFDGS